MPLTHRILLVSTALIITGLAEAQTVRVKWEKGTDFSKFQTYTWLESPTEVAEQTRRFIHDDIDAHLSINSIFRDDYEPDLEIIFYGSSEESFDITGGYRSDWTDPQAVTIENHIAGTLVVDIIDRSRQQVVWRGIATATIKRDPKKNLKTVRKALEQMFVSFPPAPRSNR